MPHLSLLFPLVYRTVSLCPSTELQSTCTQVSSSSSIVLLCKSFVLTVQPPQVVQPGPGGARVKGYGRGLAGVWKCCRRRNRPWLGVSMNEDLEEWRYGCAASRGPCRSAAGGATLDTWAPSLRVTSGRARAHPRSLCFDIPMPRSDASAGENQSGDGSTGCGDGDKSQSQQAAATATLAASVAAAQNSTGPRRLDVQSSAGPRHLDGWLPSPSSDLPDALLTKHANEASRTIDANEAAGPSVPVEGVCHECHTSTSATPLTHLPGCPATHAFFCVECRTYGESIASSSSAALSLLWCPVCRASQ